MATASLFTFLLQKLTLLEEAQDGQLEWPTTLPGQLHILYMLATPLWTATRPGIFYFSCNGPSEKGGSTTHCQRGQKVAVLVYGKPHEGFHGVAPELSPSYAPAPKHQRLKIPKRAGSLARSPSRSPRATTWAAPGSSPSPSPVPVPPVLPDFSKGIPFISSNPALPLPKGETDAATIRPLPTSGGEGQGKPTR
ncbi:hypothetical protein EJ110_NYTH20673 [Nymphaea thermarum]|nr:hypothetical protein EJ110_NYTH20673 [Nymphaea thermarum]